MGRAIGVLALLAVVGGVSLAVYRAALTPEELREHDANRPTVDWSKVTDDPTRELTITWMGPPYFPGGGPGEWLCDELHREFNVRFVPIVLDGPAYARRKPLMFAGGDVPDVFLDPDPTDVQRDAYHGFMLAIDHEVFVEHCPSYVRKINEVGAVGWMYGWWNGANYGLPTAYLAGRDSRPGVWRLDWLRKVGIDEIPRTLDEFHEALRRFTFDDPDGNGKQDTYGMSGAGQSWWWASFNDVFGAHGVAPYDWMERDGKVVWGGITPEAKETLALLQSWFKDGIIDPECVTDIHGGVTNSCDQKFKTGRIGYICYSATPWIFDESQTSSWVSIMRKFDSQVEIAPGHLPVGPRGESGSRGWGGGGWTICFGRRMAEEPEKVLRVLHMLERVYSDEALYVKLTRGLRGVHWDYRRRDGTDQERRESGVEFIGDMTDASIQSRELLKAGTGFFIPVCHDEWESNLAPKWQVDFRKKHQPVEQLDEDLFGKPDAVPSAGERMLDLRALQMRYYIEIVTDRRPVEDFEEFKRLWLERGGQQMLDEAQELLEVRRTIFRKVGVLIHGRAAAS